MAATTLELNEQIARLPGITEVHPLQDVQTVQGGLQLMHDRRLAVQGRKRDSRDFLFPGQVSEQGSE